MDETQRDDNPAVRRRQRRAQAMVAEGRNGDVWRDGAVHRFVIDSTHRHRTGYGNRYVGWIRIQEEQLVDGECSCPDWQKGRARVGGLPFCKHLGWAALKAEAALGAQRQRARPTRVREDPRAVAGKHFRLGLAYEAQGRWEEAVHEYQAAVRIMPSDADVRFRLVSWPKSPSVPSG